MNIPWEQLGIYLFSYGHQVTPIRGDGFCFLNAIDLVLYCKYNEVVMVDSLASNILGHIAVNGMQRVTSNVETVVIVSLI